MKLNIYKPCAYLGAVFTLALFVFFAIQQYNDAALDSPEHNNSRFIQPDRGAGQVDTYNRLIEFHGKVLSENGDAVPGARIRYSIRVGGENERVIYGVVDSNRSGRFSVSGYIGHFFQLENIEKVGFKLPDNFKHGAHCYDYLGTTHNGVFMPQEKSPVLFVLIPVGTRSDILHHPPKSGRIPVGGAITLSLPEIRTVTGNGLRIEMKPAYKNDGIPSSLELHCTDRSLAIVRCRDLYPISAPLDGYSAADSVAKIDFSNAQYWYYRRANGIYGIFTITVYASDVESTGMRISISVVENQNIEDRRLTN